MGDTKEKMLPGIEAYIDQEGKGFSKIEMLLEATGGLSLSQVCAVTGLEGSTIQNWVKRGWVAHPKGKKYEEVHVARILIINALKECIKLEHISLLMSYVKGADEDDDPDAIKESELFNFLCDALGRMGQPNDQSRGGVESVVNMVIKGYKGSRPGARTRIRKALTLMIYACVCTDVKRRTEAMMGQILHELENPERAAPEPPEPLVAPPAPEPPPEAEASSETRKTVSQALREWDISSVERVIIDHEEESGDGNKSSESSDKSSLWPWFSRKGSK